MIRITQATSEIRTGSIAESPRAIAIAFDCCILALQWRGMRLDDDYVNFIFEIVPANAIEQLAEELRNGGFGKLFDPAEDHHQMGFRRTGFRKPPKSAKKPISQREFADRLGRELKTRDGEITALFLTWLKRQKQELGKRKNGQKDELSKRINSLAKMFRLSPCAADLFLALYLLSRQQRLHCAISFTINCPALLERVNFLSALGRWAVNEVRLELMENSPLRRYELVDSDLDLPYSITSYLEGLSEKPLSSQFFGEIVEKPLPLEAHADFAVDIEHMKKLITGRRQGESLNILLYGVPGTGKTELAHSLGFALGYRMYDIKCMDASSQSKGGHFRLAAVHACLNTANLEQGLIIVDEADDLLNCKSGNFLAALFGGGISRNSGDKGSLNHLLDGSKTTIIWISNEHNGIEESTRRRFDYSVEFLRFSKGQRLRVWRTLLAKHRLGWLSDVDVEQLSTEHAVNAGGIELAVKNATRILRADGVRNMRQAKREDVLAAISPTIRSHVALDGTSIKQPIGFLHY
jgi:hypothetical protein